MPKRAQVPQDTFSRKPSALDRLVGNAPEQPAPAPAAASPAPEPAATGETAKEGRTYKPTSFYLDDNQLDKLDDLAHEYKKHRNKRINRNDIVRALVDRATLDNVLEAMP